MSGDGRFLGIDVGGTKIATAVLEDGAFETFEPVPTRTDTSDALVAQIAEEIERHRGADARAVAVGLPSIIDNATGRVRHTVNLPLQDLPLRALLSERCRPAGLRRERRVVRGARRGVQRRPDRVGEPGHVHDRDRRGRRPGAQRQALPRRDERRRARPHDDRARPGRRRAGRSGQLPAARLAGDAGVGPRARPARARVGPRAPEVVPRPPAREGRRDHRPRRGRGRAGGRRALPARAPRARRAARHRDRQRDQHVRPGRGRDRRRRVARRRPPARARRAHRPPPHRAGRRHADEGPARAARPAGRRARRGDGRRAGVGHDEQDAKPRGRAERRR